jgi:hypothetical protein
MDWATFLGVTMGSFILPAAAFWIFFRWARRSERTRTAKIVAGWALGLFLIYAATLPGGQGFLKGLTWGHLLAIALGIFLSYRAAAKEVAPTA